MAKKKRMASGGYEIGRLVDQSGGMVDEVVHPTLLQDSEAALLKNVSLDEKGTIKPCLGRIERFAEPFDPNNPCNGLYAYYPDTTTSRLIMGAGDKLFKDTPHLVTRWTEQSDFEEQGSELYNCDTTTKPGEIRVKKPPKATFTRASKAYLPDGTSVDNDKPRFIPDNLALGKPVTTNGEVRKGSLSMVTDGCLLSLSETHVDITGDGEPKYVQVDLGAVKKIAEIRVWHYHADERTYKNTKTEVSKDGVAWEVVFDSATKGTYKETATGHRISFDTKEVRYVRDWLNGSDKNNDNHWVEIQILSPFKEGILIEEGTTNLLTAESASFEGGTIGDWTRNLATISIVSNGWHGSKGLKVVSSTTSGRAQIDITSKVAVGDTISLTAWARLESGSPRTVSMAITVSGVSVQAESKTIYSDRWTKISVTRKLTTLGDGVYIQLFGGQYQVSTGTAIWDGIQLEKNSCTSFTDGTRAGEKLIIPSAVISDDQGSFELRARKVFVDNTDYRKILDAENPRIDFQWSRSGELSAHFGGAVVSVPDPAQDTDWHYYAVTYSERTVKMYYDGVILATGEATVDLASFADLYIGSHYDGSKYQANAVFDDLRISNKARTDEEILTTYQSGEPLPVDEYTTAKMSFDGSISVTNGGFVWISDKKDMSNVQDTETGKAEVKVNTPGESSVAIQTRSSADGVAWDDWQPVYGDGTIQSEHNSYMQVKAVGHGTETDKPSVQEIILSYDGAPTATELDIGLSPGGQWHFATLLSKCVMTNKLDPPKVWDGNKPIEILKGSPPHAQYITAHKNYLFMAGSSEGPSRLYFSEVLNIESWPVLNFIDVSPNDGDWITGLLPYDDYLIVTKNRSVWLLVGSGPSDFEVRRIHDGVGCVASRSLVRVIDSFAFASTEGIYLSDISTPTLISERLKETWKKMNRRRLHQIAGEYYDHKLRIDIPFGSSTTNNIRIIYDTIRKCLYLQEMSAHASCYAKYSEAGQEVLLFGHAHNGQVSQADAGTSDAGLPITMEWSTKHFNFGSSAVVKKARNLYFVTIPPSAPVEVLVYLIVDGVEIPTPLVFTVEPGKTVYKLKPRTAGVRNMRSLGYRVVQSGGVRFHELIQEYLMKKVKPS